MTKNLKRRKFRIEVFVIAFGIVFILTTFSFLAAWGRDEGTLGPNDGVIWNLLADSNDIFRLPIDGLLRPSATENSGSLFILTIIINMIFWTIVAERLVTMGTRLIRYKRMNSNVHERKL
jgi:hypothetical protein